MKLDHYGVRNNTLSWIQDFLSDHTTPHHDLKQDSSENESDDSSSSSVEDGDEDSSPLLNETKDDVPFDDEMDQEDLTSSNNVEKVDNPNEIGGFTVLGEVKGKAHKQVCSSCALCNLIGVNEEKILPTNIHLNLYYKIGICCFSTKHAAYRRKSKDL
jgi:hypothetical protein